MLRSRDKLTGETGPRQDKKNVDLPEPEEGDCRECAFFVPPVSTGQSEDWRFVTDDWRVMPCGRGRCVGKEFITPEDLKKLQKKTKKATGKGKDDDGKGEGGTGDDTGE